MEKTKTIHSNHNEVLKMINNGNYIIFDKKLAYKNWSTWHNGKIVKSDKEVIFRIVSKKDIKAGNQSKITTIKYQKLFV